MSSNPIRFPAILKAWQGNPAQSTSKYGCEVSDIFLASLYSGYEPKFFLYVSLAYFSHSQEPTHSCPAFSIPNLNPPIPENKSIYVNFLLFIIIYFNNSSSKFAGGSISRNSL